MEGLAEGVASRAYPVYSAINTVLHKPPQEWSYTVQTHSKPCLDI